MNKHIPTIIIAALLVLGLIVAFLQSEKFIKYQAIDGCLNVGKAQFKNSADQNVTVPDGYWYEFCMKEKKLK